MRVTRTWLAGSVVAGTATASSDLDVTVLLAGQEGYRAGG